MNLVSAVFPPRRAPVPGAGRWLMAACLMVAAGCSGGDETGRALSGVLITLDTTNAWALDSYGRVDGITPNLAYLAEEGVLYERARSVAPLTLPSHASMLTGLYPIRHTVRDNGHRPLPQSAVTLAEQARDSGRQTAAFLSAIVLSAPFGLDQGFEVYDCPEDAAMQAAEHMAERPGNETVRKAQMWLRARDRTRPFFLWVHLFDPHAPYEAPQEFVDRSRKQPYLAEVAAMDDAVGDLLASLRAEGAWEESLIVVAGDHGESMGAHSEDTHSVFCYDATLHVPLIVRYPDGRDAGKRVKQITSVVDVFPTFTAGLGLPGATDVDGVDLGGPLDRERGVYFESYCGYLNYGWSPLLGWVDRHGKYLHSSRPELYDPAQDPGEERNLLASRKDDAERYRAAIARLAQRSTLAPDDLAAGTDAVAQERLMALGYAGAADAEAEIPHPLEPSSRPSPRDCTAELDEIYAALLLSVDGDRLAAIEKMRTVAEANPANVFAVKMVGAFLSENGQYEEAIGILEGVLSGGGDSAVVRDHLGHANERIGKLDEALAHFQRALEWKRGDAHQTEDVERIEGLLAERDGK